MSIGAARVRESFNPSEKNIDICEDFKHLDPRLAALAQTAYEEAAMWAVKAATTEKKDAASQSSAA